MCSFICIAIAQGSISRNWDKIAATLSQYITKAKRTNAITRSTSKMRTNLINYHATFAGIAFSMFDGISMLNPSAAVDTTIPGI